MPKIDTALLTHAQLVLYGQLPTSDEITSLLGVAPTKYWRAGEINARSPIGASRTEDTCIYSVKVEQPATLPDPGEAIGQLLALFPDLSVLSKLGPLVFRTCVLGVTGYKERPYANVQAGVLRQLAQCDLSLNIDFYDLSRTDERTSQ